MSNLWKQMVTRNKLSKKMDVDKDNLSIGGKKAQEMTKKTTKLMQKNQAHSKSLIESILKTEGITSLQMGGIK
jgi:hypothetical protein